MHYYEYKNKGFSLIELATVIGVLGILSAIAIPTFLQILEKTADRVVRISLLQSYKDCKIDILSNEKTPTFQLDMGTVRRNGFYKFYQQYDYVPREDGYVPPTILGNCIGPLGPHRLGVIKTKGKNKDSELWINLSTGEKIEKGDLKWD